MILNSILEIEIKLIIPNTQMLDKVRSLSSIINLPSIRSGKYV